MSASNSLAAQISRGFSAFPFEVSVTVEDGDGGSRTITVGRPGRPAPGRRQIEDMRRILGRIMDGAPGGAVASASADGGDLVLAAPGGAFDGRATSPIPVQPEGATSPSADAASVSAGQSLSRPSRALYVGASGDLVVTMQSGAVVTFHSAPAGMTFPVKVKEIGESTTAAGLVALF